MKIKDHLLYTSNEKTKQEERVAQKPTPNHSGLLRPKYLLMHFTAVTRAEGSISWLADPTAKASAHLLIDREGNVTQFAPFNVITWHAGPSRWNGLSGLNSHSIGIELVNGGKLVQSGDQWFCAVDRRPVPADQVVMGRHKNEDEVCPWHSYSDRQLQTAIEIGALLVREYGLIDVLGHDDVAPHRKPDPGPAFPMASFRSRVMGREDESLDIYKAAVALNIRKGPGTGFETLTDALPKDTPVKELKREGNWSFVEVEAAVHGLNDLEGWVATKHLIK